MPADGFSIRAAAPRLPRVMNNFVHDMCTGIWFACVSSSSWSWTAARWECPSKLPQCSHRRVWPCSGCWSSSLVGIAVTGADPPALLASARPPPDLLRAKRPALIAKHVAFIVMFGLGTLWAARLAFG